MTAGTNDKKKVIFLGILVLVALYFVYSNLFSGPSVSAPPASPASASAPAPQASAPVMAAMPEKTSSSARAALNRAHSEEFHPVLHPKRPEDRIDPTTIDPTLRLDLLAKVEAVDLAGGSRNLFQVGPPPPPPAKPAEVLKGKEPKIALKPPGPALPAKPSMPVDPPPPPITLKYYGFSTTRDDGRKTAFFLDGDDILVASEGETLKKRYKVVRIGPASVMMEDTQSKRQQSVPLAPEAAG